jgi:hypothetical protein
VRPDVKTLAVEREICHVGEDCPVLSAEYGNTLGGVITINTQKGSKEPKLYFDT